VSKKDLEAAAKALGVEVESLTKMNREAFDKWLANRAAAPAPAPVPVPPA